MQVLDARDPQGTRCLHLERHLRTEARHKHLLFLLNKCDLVRLKAHRCHSTCSGLASLRVIQATKVQSMTRHRQGSGNPRVRDLDPQTSAAPWPDTEQHPVRDTRIGALCVEEHELGSRLRVLRWRAEDEEHIVRTS